MLLATTSIIGTVILQNAPQSEYIDRYGLGLTNFIKTFSFDDMYHAEWFLFLILILCINIVVCSIDRLEKTWKIIFPKKITFNTDRFLKQKNLLTYTADNTISQEEKCQAYLSKSVGKVIKEKTDTGTVLYAEQGRWSRVGVYIVHSSILFMLVGALIGAILGFKANLRLDEGASSDVAFLAKNRLPVQMGFTVRCDDFDLELYDNGQPKDYTSTLTVIENGTETFTKDIEVNHPLRYKGINIFQSSYGPIGMDKSLTMEIVSQASKQTQVHKLKIGDKVALPDNKGFFVLKGIEPHYKFMNNNLGTAFVGQVIPDQGEPFDIHLPIKHAKFDKMRKGQFAFIIKQVGQKYYTGLQVTKDPGIWYVYIGFILIIIGCWITFFISHQSFLIHIQSTDSNTVTISLSGITNRNHQGMKLKINKMLNQLKG